MKHSDTPKAGRDSFASRWGFILACIGSAVGMGNIWLFPARVAAYGGTFLIPYLLFVLLIGSTGVIGEMSFGRAAGAGPVDAFAMATERRLGRKMPGRALGMIPVLGSLAMGIGYSVVMGWILKYAWGAVSGSLMAVENLDGYIGLFNGTASAWGNNSWQAAAVLAALAIMAFGIGTGIEKMNKVMMPLFYFMFVGLAVYVAFLPGAADGYRYIFTFSPEGLLDPMVWVYAMGQAFFSLSVAGNGTLIYGSYLSKKENVPSSAKMVAVFDTSAALLAALVLIPAMATAGQQITSGGPGLMFIFLPNLFKGMPGGGVIMVVFFVAVFFAGITSLVNLFEAPTATVQELFRLKRHAAVAVIGGIGLVVGLAIQGIVSDWMDVCSIYICPIGAFLAAVMFFWVCGKDYCLEQVNLARSKPLGAWFYPLAKYVFCGVALVVLIMGALTPGGIG